MSPRPAGARPAARRRPRSVRKLVAVALAASLALLSACTADDSLADQAKAGDDKGYIAGSGTITQLAPDERKDPVDASSVDLDGNKVRLADWRGDVVVVNFWYAACAPCRVEAPDLESTYQGFQQQGVKFLGANTSDAAAAAKAFDRKFKISYPSVLDSDGAVLSAFRGVASPQATPTTIVMDKKGRVAARVSGRADASTLKALIDDVLKESA